MHSQASPNDSKVFHNLGVSVLMPPLTPPKASRSTRIRPPSGASSRELLFHMLFVGGRTHGPHHTGRRPKFKQLSRGKVAPTEIGVRYMSRPKDNSDMESIRSLHAHRCILNIHIAGVVPRTKSKRILFVSNRRKTIREKLYHSWPFRKPSKIAK
jgi:hypothetical protein